MGKVKKVKRKTHKGTKKILNQRQSGSITKLNAGNNHMTGKKTPAQSKKAGSKSALSKSDYKRFKDDDAFTCAFITSCFTGMRTGEVCSLTWEDIDFKNRHSPVTMSIFSSD